MGHEGPDHGTRRGAARGGQGRRLFVVVSVGVVDRLVVAVGAPKPLRGQAAKVARGLGRLQHGGEGRGIGCDHELVAETALQSESGHSEGLVLVVVVPVHEVVGRLRDAPGYAAVRRVRHLPPHRHPAGLVEEGLRIAPHEEERHQVLEQGCTPGEEGGRTVHVRDQASEVEPVRLRKLALRDADEAREAGLGGEEVVVRGVETPRPLGVGQAIADGEDSALRLVKEAKAHPVREGGGPPREVREPGFA